MHYLLIGLLRLGGPHTDHPDEQDQDDDKDDGPGYTSSHVGEVGLLLALPTSERPHTLAVGRIFLRLGQAAGSLIATQALAHVLTSSLLPGLGVSTVVPEFAFTGEVVEVFLRVEETPGVPVTERISSPLVAPVDTLVNAPGSLGLCRGVGRTGDTFCLVLLWLIPAGGALLAQVLSVRGIGQVLAGMASYLDAVCLAGRPVSFRRVVPAVSRRTFLARPVNTFLPECSRLADIAGTQCV